VVQRGAVQPRIIARSRSKRRRAWQARVVVALALGAWSACSAPVAKLTNPASPRCQDTLRAAFESILLDQQESEENATQVANSAAQALADVDLGAEPFQVQSPATGIDYGFVFQRDGARCLLHLVAMQAGALQLNNNLTYLETRLLKGCGCVQ
jgi:hypothetical protein